MKACQLLAQPGCSQLVKVGSLFCVNCLSFQLCTYLQVACMQVFIERFRIRSSFTGPVSPPRHVVPVVTSHESPLSRVSGLGASDASHATLLLRPPTLSVQLPFVRLGKSYSPRLPGRCNDLLFAILVIITNANSHPCLPIAIHARAILYIG